MQFVVDEPLAPAGNVQVYDVAPGTGSTQYTTVVFRHAPAGPLIGPGFGGIDVPVTIAVAVAVQPIASVTVTV